MAAERSSEQAAAVQPAEALLEAPGREVDLPHVRALDLGGGVALPLCWIPPGSTRVGSRDRQFHDERPVHRVDVERGFWLGQTAVTQDQWRAIHGSLHDQPFGQGPEHGRLPVVNLSWFEALDACRRMQARWLPNLDSPVGPEDAIREAKNCRAVTWSDGPGFRLPSEVEWEHACRGAGHGQRGLVERPAGDGAELVEATAWILTNSGERLHPVDEDPDRSYPPHPLGLRQMLGNVSEWCLDLWFEERWAELYPGRGAGGNGRSSGARWTASQRLMAADAYQLATSGEAAKDFSTEVRGIVEAGRDLEEGLAQLQVILDNQFASGVPMRVVRGGSWSNGAAVAASAYRNWRQPGIRVRNNGLRVCLSPRPSPIGTATGPERRSAGRATPGGARSGADPRAAAQAGGRVGS